MNTENEALANTNESWWAASEGVSEAQTVILRRRENGAEPLLDRFTVSPEMMPSFDDFEFAVKERYGGGLYVAVVNNARGHFVKKIPFAIAGLPKQEHEQAADKQQPGLAELFMQMQQASDARFERLIETMAGKKEEKDPFEMVERVAGIMGKFSGAPKPEKTFLEQLQEIEAAKTLIRGNEEKGGSEFSDLIGLLNGPMASAITAGMAENRAKAAQVKKPAKAAPRAQAQSDTKTLPAPTEPQAVTVNDMKAWLDELIEAAEAGHSAAEVAGHLMNAEGADQLKNYVRNPGVLMVLASINPGVTKHHAWFEELRKQILGDDGDSTRNEPAAEATRRESRTETRRTRNPSNLKNDGGIDASRARKPASTKPRAVAGRAS